MIEINAELSDDIVQHSPEEESAFEEAYNKEIVKSYARNLDNNQNYNNFHYLKFFSLLVRDLIKNGKILA
jgi:hypothetical protein